MIAIGTHSLGGEECREAIRVALSLGYRRIDTASSYRNEHFVADGIECSGVPRQDIYITTKIGPKDMAKGEEGVLNA